MLGVNIGLDNPWTPKQSLKKLSTDLRDVQSVKFYHADPHHIIPFGVSKRIKNIYIHLTNEELFSNIEWARWIEQHVKPICNRITTKNIILVLGNEVLADHNIKQYGPKLLPVLRSCHAALNESGLGKVKIVTPLDTSCLQDSDTPSESSFKTDLVPILREIILFLISTGSKLAFNIYPHLTHTSEDFALFGDSAGYNDKGKQYTDFFCTQYDSIIQAVTKMGVRGSKRLKLIVTETGWSSGGDCPEKTFNYVQGIKKICKTGTPLRKGPIEIIIFELFDQNGKHFGIYDHEGIEKTN